MQLALFAPARMLLLLRLLRLLLCLLLTVAAWLKC